ncbi:hypothetical protein VTP01DRAFT_2068 [Rhizomucor pusillus]|uniref:uncharacterized protein n=1 Tax=Rhizomucor pusillus TaxID=4840 RepID=UPI00374354F3
MSKSQQSGTARNYVESIVKDQDTETLLSESQPQYDPNKKPAAPSSSSEPASQTSSTSTQKERTFHRATFNPIASEEVAADAATAPQADVQWGPREFLKQREEIKETAQLACADLEVELLDCFKTGHMWEKSNLCNDQRNRFWACFNKCRDIMKEADYKGPTSNKKKDAQIFLKLMSISEQIREESEANKS